MDLLERQVLTSLEEGNESAIEMLFKTYYQPLCQYAYSFLRDKDEAEEVVQSAFINIWDKREEIFNHGARHTPGWHNGIPQ